MNTPNNKRRQESRLRIERAFANLIQETPLDALTVTQVCKLAQINRSTFYANYPDIADLANQFRGKMAEDIKEVYREEREHAYNSNNFLKLFQHIQDNQLFYRTYFRLDAKELPIEQYDIHLADLLYGGQHIDYHIAFFKAGLNAVLQKWLAGGCTEPPETINDIITEEYLCKGKRYFPGRGDTP